MKTDREILESAAMASGMTRLWFGPDGPRMMENGVATHQWNPLTDDGDALRLAVKLGLEVGHNSFGNVLVDHYTQPEVRKIVLPHGNNPYAATRRAIVLAAAAMAVDGELVLHNVRVEAGPAAKCQARVVENAPAHFAGLAF